MNSLVMWIGGLLAAVLAALFAVPLFVDWNGYRGVIEEEASRILGRDVRVGGNINVRLLPTPYLRFEKLRIADISEGASEPLFRADAFTLWLSVPPLLKGDLEVRRMALEKPVVTLKLDRDGVGNWASLGIETRRLPFVPQNVALQSVEIGGGAIVLHHAIAGELARLDDISGEFAAESLAGPYKLTADARWNGAMRELRLATGAMDAAGTLRFKGSARTKTGAGERAGVSAQLDGAVVDLTGRARVEGQVALQMPLPELPAATVQAAAGGVPEASPAAASQAPAPSGDAAPLKPSGPVTLDIKGRLLADARQLTGADLVASVDNVGQPQLATAAASLAWGSPPRLDFSAASRWLDFDRLAPSSGRASPVETLGAMARGLLAALPAGAIVQGNLGIEQITLGGEAVSGLDIAVKRDAAGPLRIERAMAELPAGGRVSLDGRLDQRDSALALDGRVTVAGPSLERLARWAAPGTLAGQLAPDGAFSLDTAVGISAGVLNLKDARGKLNGHAFTATAAVPLSGTGSLSVALDADVVESNWLWKGGLDRTGFLAWLDRLSQLASASAAPPQGTAASMRDVALRLRTGQLRGPDRTLDDVAADIEVRDGVLRFKQLAMRSGDALRLDLSGEVAASAIPAAAGTVPVPPRRGRIDGTISVANTASVGALFNLLQLPESDRTRRLATLAPIALAGSMAAAERTPSALDVRLDGTLGGGRVTLAALLDGGLEDWIGAPAEITMSAENAPVDELTALLTGAAKPAETRPRGDASRIASNASLKAVGAPRQGLVTDAVVSGRGVQIAYNGRTVLDADARPALDGMLEVAADRLGDVLAITGLGQAGSGLEQAVTGTLGLASVADGKLRLSPSGLTIAGARVDGALQVARDDHGRAKIAGEIAVDRASVGGLLTGLVSGAPRPMPVTPPRTNSAKLADVQADPGPSPSPWSDQPFASEAFDRFDGNVTLRVARLALAPGLAAADARLAVEFARGRVVAGLSEAKALGGRFAGNLTLEQAPAGVRATGKLAADGVLLAEIARAAASPVASGKLWADVTFAGQALSPRALVNAFEGKGRMTIGEAEIGALVPEAIQSIVTSAFAKRIATDEASILAAVKDNLGKGRIALGPREIAIVVDDGAVKLDRFELRSGGGRVEGVLTVDLATFDAEAEWRTVARNEEQGRADWPRISVFNVGPLAEFGKVEPRVALGGFERELSVRRMEREVEELERIRKEDEERARQERERQRAAEAERKRAAEVERQRLIELERQRRIEQQQQREAPAGQSSLQPTHNRPPTAAATPPGAATEPVGGAVVPGAQQTGQQGGPPQDTGNGPSSPAGTWTPSTTTTGTPSYPASSPPMPSVQGTITPPVTTDDSVVPRPRAAARPRREPSASDTLLKSFSPSTN